MPSTAIRIENLSKRYLLGTSQPYKTLRETFMSALRRPFRSGPRDSSDEARTLWALRDVSLKVEQGEILGIVGLNGAGKSTLLKVLSRITQPTTGCIEMVGRVGSLLEVGTGFHPELSGRENIFLNGAVLGMSQREIVRKFDEIVAFSEVERFIDTPVKRYSSGMYMRLAFGVAAHLEPEILVVDEVLAVGDVGFQKKCLRKMDEVAGQGRTVLFVSHNIGMVRQLCTRGALLSGGRLAMEGPIEDVLIRYERELTRSAGAATWVNPQPDTDTEVAYLQKVEIVGTDGQLVEDALNSDSIYVRMYVRVREPSAVFKVGFDLIKSGTTVWRLHQTDSFNPPRQPESGMHVITCHIPPGLLNLGEYYITPQMSLHCVRPLLNILNPVLRFRVHLDTSVSSFHGVLDERNHPGLVFPLLEWKSVLVDHQPN
ncbi:ABC transporter ATP-binding protein [Humisphaera borealis]|uniref:ABC transporter ATP-binding protein n=1 Tax=Humisphaera borealis TaxID=2807512 RepID=A0A7M2X306_9BACT|nr:ABC transporter ATP-binding protein [Humisphaera borealis]QOV91411.1 ABC transporter ATP-binding protein [Humisphaera borealis]